MSIPVIEKSTPAAVKASYWFPDGETHPTPHSVENIDSTLFTHLFGAFAELNSQTNRVFIPEAHEYTFSVFTDIDRQKNHHVQTLLSIGGRKADQSAFASMASDSTSRASFIDSSIELARSNGFYGLDLAWEYPSNDVEMRNFGKLLEEWRTAVDDESERSGRVCLLLTAAVYYTSQYNSVLYPIEQIKENLDWVNVIAYDFYGPGWSPVTGPTAALFNSFKIH